MAELPSIDHLFNAPSSSVHWIREAQTTIYNSLPPRAGGMTGNDTPRGVDGRTRQL